MSKKLQHIELFAGCGGMSLGLEAAGFHLYFANELSPMASETFAYNILKENLQELAARNEQSEKVLWINSKFQKQELRNRLRENPLHFEDGEFTDIDPDSKLKGKLLVGNINHLLEYLHNNPKVCSKLQNENIDLISGGPPCQSFSLAGRREKDNHKNSLPLSFAQIAGLVKPKIVLLENVKGITNPFSINGQKYHAWIEVAKAFCLQGYIPICMMVNSKYYGIPQNRPRFILLAIRKDIGQKLSKTLKKKESQNILNASLNFFDIVWKNKNSLQEISIGSISFYDIEKVPELFNGEILPAVVNDKENFISAKEAIDDLFIETCSRINIKSSPYVSQLNKLFKRQNQLEKHLNHDVRNHGRGVVARFRWFQVINNLNGLAQQASKLVSGERIDPELTYLIWEKIRGEQLLLVDGAENEMVKLKTHQDFLSYIKTIHTKKHSQRAIKESEPAPAQLTVPDDLCHYSISQIRTLTVREMARFQSFPDWFEFRSKVTTGGNQRSFEVPQYTQVGNAVPPLLAFHLGNLVKKILKQVNNV